MEAWSKLQKCHRILVQKPGFGKIKDCKIMGSISRKLIGWLMNKLKTEDTTITFGDKKEKKVI